MKRSVKYKPIIVRNGREANGEVEINKKPRHTQYIFTLTRCCTQNCDFCAVDALYCPTVAGCAERAHKEQLSGRELSPEQWCTVVEKILAIDSFAEFDLSGGDCLSLPWVSQKLIPYILQRVHNRTQLSVTSTADSLVAWLDNINESCLSTMPGAVHVTFDGYRQYSFDNIRLASQVRRLGMEFHIECPLTEGNCSLDKVHDIYYALKDAEVREILLMRFFPVGRGAEENGHYEMEPSTGMYQTAIAEFYRLAAKYPNGPIIKVQCALKEFEPERLMTVPCKMGDSTWCVMPNGILLICPWAYGMNGRPLDGSFVAGNIFDCDYEICRSKGRDLRDALRKKYSRKCRILAFIEDSRYRATICHTNSAEGGYKHEFVI